MKADLPRREPEVLKQWQSQQLYAHILAKPVKQTYVLHDGPPYANGHIHYGHILN